MQWPEDIAGWPMAEHSRRILCRPHRWHVQEAGTGKTLLLIHGAGGATQSWRHLFPILMQDFHVVAVDLPGQGFTQAGARSRYGLDATAEDIQSLIRHEGWTPAALIGHSAGAAIALRLRELDGLAHVPVVGINAALGSFKGVAGWLFPALAKALAATPMAAQVFAATMTRDKVRRLIQGTGSVLDDRGMDLYLRLASDPGHVDATLAMMAQWRLDELLSRMGDQAGPVRLIVGAGDLAVLPSVSLAAAAALRDATVTTLPGLGHLAHEERADLVMDALRDALVF